MWYLLGYFWLQNFMLALASASLLLKRALLSNFIGGWICIIWRTSGGNDGLILPRWILLKFSCFLIVQLYLWKIVWRWGKLGRALDLLDQMIDFIHLCRILTTWLVHGYVILALVNLFHIASILELTDFLFCEHRKRELVFGRIDHHWIISYLRNHSSFGFFLLKQALLDSIDLLGCKLWYNAHALAAIAPMTQALLPYTPLTFHIAFTRARLLDHGSRPNRWLVNRVIWPLAAASDYATKLIDIFSCMN